MPTTSSYQRSPSTTTLIGPLWLRPNVYELLTEKCEIKMAVLLVIFLRVYGPRRTRTPQKKKEKKKENETTIPPSCAKKLVDKGFIMWKKNNNKSKRHTRTPTHGLTSTLRMRTAISPGQWQPWTTVSTLLGLISMA